MIVSKVVITMEGLEKKLKALREKSKNASPLTHQFAVIMEKDINDHFDKEQGEEGSWQALAYTTLLKNPKRWGGKILQDTGRLINSLLPSNDEKSAAVTTKVEYATSHQYGTDRIPQRDFMWISKAARELLNKVAAKFFAEV